MGYFKKLLISFLLLCLTGGFEALALQLYQVNREYGGKELGELNWFELCLLKNEIYAGYGYNFGTPWLNAHYTGQYWYEPTSDINENSSINSKLTPAEQNDLTDFIAASENLGKTMSSCWNFEDHTNYDYDYYRAVTSFKVPGIGLPAHFDSYDFGGGAIQIWSSPKALPDNLLPKRAFSEVFERSDTVLEDLWGSSRDSFYEAVDNAKKLLDDYEAGDTVYRVYYRGDGSISVVEAMGLGAADSSWQLKPYVLWRAWFDKSGAILLYRPVYKGGGWISTEVVAAFTGSPNATEVRCLIYGNVHSIDMEVRKGPYPELPFTINLYDADRDGDDRYTRLIE